MRFERSVLRRAVAPAVFLFAASFAAPAAHAEEAVEAALNAWIASVDLSPDWHASVDTIAMDGGKAVVRGLHVQSAEPGFALDLPTITVSGYTLSPSGTFRAGDVSIPAGTLTAGPFTVAIANAEFHDVMLPTASGFAWNATDPIASVATALAPLTRVGLSAARLGALILTETFQGVRSRVAYEHVEIDGWQGNRIARAAAKSLKSEAPSPSPFITLSASEAESRDIDLAAMLAMHDPGLAPGGRWRKAIGHVVEKNFTVGIGKLTGRIGEIRLDDLSVRPPAERGPPPVPSVTPLSPLDAALGALDALSNYRIGKLAIDDAALELTQTDQVHLANLTLSDASTERLGGFSIAGLSAATGGNSIAVGKFGLGGLVLPPRAALTAAVAALKDGGNVDLTSLVPGLDRVEAAGIDVALDTMPRTSLDRLELDLGKRIGTLPTTVKLDLAGADFDPALIPDPRPEAFAKRFGFDRVHADAAADITWGKRGNVAVKDFKLGVKGVGALSGSASLNGPEPAVAAATIHTTDDLMAALTLKDATVTFADDGAVAAGLAAQAKRVNRDPAQFREQFAKGLPLLLTFLGNPDMQKQLAGALKTFITEPGTITFKLSPPAPVPVATLADTAKISPFALLGTLGVNVTAVAGAPQPAASGNLRKTMSP